MEKCASNDFYTFLEVEYENIRYYFCISLKKKIKIGIELQNYDNCYVTMLFHIM
jgi:hypothetical protein